MKHYKSITCFENRRRLVVLTKFRDDVVLYFDDCNSYVSEKKEQAIRVRQEINQTLVEVHDVFLAAGMVSIFRYVIPPIGEHVQYVNILENLFDIQQWGMTHQDVIDYLERAIGIYKSDYRKSILRTINPFWWGLRGLNWIAYMPFRFLRAAGFDAEKAEKGVGGRFVNLLFHVIIMIAALVGIFTHIGWLDEIKHALGISP